MTPEKLAKACALGARIEQLRTAANHLATAAKDRRRLDYYHLRHLSTEGCLAAAEDLTKQLRAAEAEFADL